MKKALLIGLVVGMIAAWAIPAMAVDLTASGFIGVKGYVFNNARMSPPWFTGNPMTLSAFSDRTGSFINSRAELGFTVRASEDLYGFFKFRMDSNIYGDDPAGRYANVGGGGLAVQVQQLFIDFRVPPKLPVWIRVGLQPFAIRPWIFYFNDVPGITARAVIDPIKLNLTAYFGKMCEADVYTAFSASELYGLDAKLPLRFGKLNIAPGAFFFWQNVRATNTAYNYNPIGALGTLDDLNLYWIGANLDGGYGPVKYQLDFIYNGGEANLWNGSHRGISSALVNGSASFVWKKLEVGVGGRWIRGEDTSTLTSETFYLPGGPHFGSESLPISGDYIVWDNGWFTMGPGWPGIGLIDGPSVFWPGYWTVRGFAYYQVLDWLKVGAQFGYIGDTVTGTDVGAYYGGSTDTDDDQNIGWEMDFGVNIQIYKNLALESGFGYLFAGKALSMAGGVEPNDPWAFQSRLMYFF